MKILLIGWGNMGGALMAGWVGSDDVTSIDVVSPHAKDKPVQTKVAAFASIEEWATAKRDVDVAVLAFKPFMFPDVCAQIKPHLKSTLPILSVAAGIDMRTLSDLLGEGHPIIRTMPNTPSQVGMGMTGYCFNDKVTPKQKDMTVSLLSVLGQSIEVADDEGINQITAISGCGPAYFYQFVEAIENAAKNIGLNDADAALLARQTFLGAAALLDATGKSPSQLRTEVTSPKGATAAGIAVFQGNQALESLVNEAVLAAQARARELGKNQ